VNTPAHLIFGAAAFGKPDRKGSLAAAMAGAFVPDLSLYVMVGVSIFVLGVPAETVFREYYYSDAWQSVFAVDNSFVLWGAFLALALWRRWPLVVAFAGAGLMHLALDFPLHTHDARQHFWPVTDWVFHSPYSYWDSRAGAGVVGPIEAGFSVFLAGLVIWRFKHWGVRVLIVALLAAELFSSGVWQFVF
jgi:hypothetical protein